MTNVTPINLSLSLSFVKQAISPVCNCKIIYKWDSFVAADVRSDGLLGRYPARYLFLSTVRSARVHKLMVPVKSWYLGGGGDIPPFSRHTKHKNFHSNQFLRTSKNKTLVTLTRIIVQIPFFCVNHDAVHVKIKKIVKQKSIMLSWWGVDITTRKALS